MTASVTQKTRPTRTRQRVAAGLRAGRCAIGGLPAEPQRFGGRKRRCAEVFAGTAGTEAGRYRKRTRRPQRWAAAAACATIAFAAMLVSPLRANQGDEAGAVPEPLRGVGIDQNLNAQIPAELTFKDEQGQAVRLGDFFDGRRPVLLTLVYYECPMLCTLVLNDTLRSLRAIPLDIGKDYQVLTISFDPTETPELAAGKKTQYVGSYGREGAAEGWHFLTGDAESIRKLTAAVGFRYRYSDERDQYIHPSGITILTPEGRISRYFFGINYAAKDVRLSLVEASDRKIGSLSESVLLFCFQYDPATGKYGWAVLNALRTGGTLTVLAIGIMLFRMFRTERRRAAQPAGRAEDASRFVPE